LCSYQLEDFIKHTYSTRRSPRNTNDFDNPAEVILLSSEMPQTIFVTILVEISDFDYLRLREEHRLKMFEKRVLKRTFRYKMKEVIGGWRKLHNEKLRNS
jgi:hypothetical protein